MAVISVTNAMKCEKCTLSVLQPSTANIASEKLDAILLLGNYVSVLIGKANVLMLREKFYHNVFQFGIS